jgi:hypothetical protein
MKRLVTILLVLAASVFASAAADTVSTSPPSLSGLRENGAFAFPQKDSKVLCDRPDLRFSVWNNDQYLIVQAVLWTYGHASLGETDEFQLVTDWSSLHVLGMDADEKAPSRVDGNYALNTPAGFDSLHYYIRLSEKAITPMKSFSKGRGAIRCIETAEGKNVRVDTYLIPMEEIHCHVGDRIRICYCGASPKWQLIVNSAGYEPDVKNYNGFPIPLSKYHEYTLTSGREIDATQFPEDRRVISPW